MGYGQYSAGSCRRTKAEMLEHFASDYQIVASKRGGHNRLDFTTANGARFFALHETVVATLSPEGDRLELADGGWPTQTTKSAWGDALAAFGIDCPSWSLMPTKAERRVIYRVEANPDFVEGGPAGRWAPRPFRVTARAEQVADLPMIRASVDDGNFAVRFDGHEIISEAGARVRCSPFKALVTLYRIDALARVTRGYSTMRGNALHNFGFEAFGFMIHPGQTSRTIMVGCHTFQTRETRAQMGRIAGEHPAAAKLAKRFVKRHPMSYGVAEYEAAQRARYRDVSPSRIVYA